MPWAPAGLSTSDSGTYSSDQQQDHTVRGRNKPQRCQSLFLSLGVVSKTLPPAEDGVFLEKHTIDHITRAQTIYPFFLHCPSIHFPSLSPLSDWSHSLAPPLHIKRITHHQPEETKGNNALRNLARQSCCTVQSQRSVSLGTGSGLAMTALVAVGYELPRVHLAFLGSSASYYPELQADGARPQSGVTLNPDWGCCGPNLQVMWMSTNVKADLYQLRNLFSPQPILKE